MRALWFAHLDGVLRMLSLILMHRPLKHPGAPRGPAPLSMSLPKVVFLCRGSNVC